MDNPLSLKKHKGFCCVGAASGLSIVVRLLTETRFGHVSMLPGVYSAPPLPPLPLFLLPTAPLPPFLPILHSSPIPISSNSPRHPYPPSPITQRQALWRTGKSRTSLPPPLPSQSLLWAGFFSGYPTPWKMGDPVAHPTLLTQGDKIRVKKPFRSFSERLITWYSSTLHL